jgi:uncharacterized membrane protein
MMQAKTKTAFCYIAPLIVLTGIILRIIVFFQNRSLIIDEANLAMNIVEKKMLLFFHSLDYEQYCPPIFLVLSKLSINLFGTNEFSLKIIPFLGGAFSLILLYFLGKHFVKEKAIQWYLLLLFSFSSVAIRYSTEVKQYSTDAVICLALVYLAILFKNKEWNLKNSLIWMFIGSISIWSSMSSIFILASVGFAFLYQSFKNKRTFPVWLVATGAVWLGNFGIYFFRIL